AEECKEVFKVSISEFKKMSEHLLSIIKTSRGSFSNHEIEQFMDNIYCKTLKAKSSDKSDIKIKVHDMQTGLQPVLGFSVKSKLGSASTLLNANKDSTNITYKVIGNLDDEKIEDINNISSRSKIKDRLSKLKEIGCDLQYVDMKGEMFKLNLQLIDSKLPEILSFVLLNYFNGESSKLEELLEIVKTNNPLQYNNKYNHVFYEYKFKNFLTDVALGMTPSTFWTGKYDATGGYIVVREDGEVVCYHIYNRNEFQDYLLKSTKLESPSSSRHKYGYLYKKHKQVFIDLNLQIRFK
ncbi:HpaII family restriction endonuclease, partial [Bacillus sp. Marseille-Q3570]|uniref:HpaII family restriction endonuclease n=1 Tax=Bacillus sp. Marseille-Q3570 TaxID=2963522 RepID=UPI0021B72820